MDKKSNMSSEIKDDIQASESIDLAESTARARTKTWTWGPIKFIAEDGGIAHQLINARLTLVHDNSTNPPTCFANFTANRVEGGRRGRFDCVIPLKGNDGADLTSVQFGNVEMACRDSSSLSLGPVPVQQGLFDLVNSCLFPATRETGVEAC